MGHGSDPSLQHVLGDHADDYACDMNVMASESIHHGAELEDSQNFLAECVHDAKKENIPALELTAAMQESSDKLEAVQGEMEMEEVSEVEEALADADLDASNSMTGNSPARVLTVASETKSGELVEAWDEVEMMFRRLMLTRMPAT